MPIADCPNPAIATSAASTRLSASRFRSIAAFQSIAASVQGGGIVSEVREAGINLRYSLEWCLKSRWQVVQNANTAIMGIGTSDIGGNR
jgi:hypothetical protein